MRRPLIVGNWKMNTTLADASILATSIKNIVSDLDIDVVLCPPFVWLYPVSEILEHSPKNIHLGAQNMWHQDHGPLTGEISPLMVKSLAKYVILGHSERREHFKEDGDLVNEKIHAALKHNLKPIVCVGEKEKLQERTIEGGDMSVITQLKEAIDGITKEDIENVIIAYEPIWAIGTGQAATGAYANNVISQMREMLANKYNDAAAQRIRILYGGSVDEDNIREYLYQPEIDGALVGGASLKVKEFIKICKEAAGRE